VPKDLRELIRMLSRENPLWGAPHIHGELLKLGINLGETSVSKYIVRRMTISQPPAGPAIRARGVNGPLATAATRKRAFAKGPSRGSPRPEPKVPSPVAPLEIAGICRRSGVFTG